ncbi:hypothetical protein A6R68_03628, partial [Neotoma lepida]
THCVRWLRRAYTDPTGNGGFSRALRNSNFHLSAFCSAPLRTLLDTSSQTPKPRKMDNSKAAEDNPPFQDTLDTSEAPFPTPRELRHPP